MTAAQRLRNLARCSPAGSRTILRSIGTGMVLLASLYYVAHKLGEGIGVISASSLRINYYLLVASIALVLFCALLGGWEWNVLLRALGADMSLRKALRVHLLSAPPKYIPLLGSQQVGKAYLCKEAGVPATAAALSVVSELAVSVLGASALSLLALSYAAPARGIPIIEPLLHLPLPWLGLGYVLLLPLIIHATLRMPLIRRFFGVGFALPFSRILLLFTAVICTWALYGLAFFLQVASLYPVTIYEIPFLVFSSTASFTIGFVTFIAPAGLGVRESVMTFLLSFALPGPYPALVAILSRIAIVAAELLGSVIATRL